MATKYLRSGGTGDWNTDASWSTTSSAGTANTVKPTASDDVILNAGSPSGNIVTTAAVCRSIDLTGYTGTLSHGNITLTIGTSTSPPGGVALKFPTSGWTYTPTNAGARIVLSNSVNNTTQTADFGGQTISRLTITPSATGGIIQLVNNGVTTGGTAPTLGVTRGTFDTNGLTCTFPTVQITGANAVTLGSSTINVTATGTAWDNQSTATVNAGTSVINMSGASVAFNGGAETYATVNFTGSGTPSINDSGNTFGTLTRTGTAVKTDGFAVSSLTATNLTLTSNSILNRLYLTSRQWGATATLTVGTYSGNNVDFSDIAGAGAGSPFTGTSLGDGLGNSGITFTAAVTRYGVVAGNWDSTAVWSATSGGAGGASVPLPQDDVVLNASSAAGTYNINVPRAGKSLDCTGFTRTFDTTAVHAFYGDYKLVNGMTATAVTDQLQLRGRGNHIVDPANKVLGGMQVAGYGGTYTLQNDWLTPLRSFTHIAGTFDANDKNVSFINYQLSFAATPSKNTRVLNMGNGTWTAAETSGAFWTVLAADDITINAEGSTIVHNTNGATGRTFAGGGYTYNDLAFTGGGVGIVTFTSSNTFNNLTLGNATGNVMFFAFQVSTTQTVTGTLTALGSATKLITITSTAGGTAASISKSSGTVNADYLSLQDSTATGGAVFYAGSNSINVSGNTGWLFYGKPVPSNPGSFFRFM